MLSLLGAAAIGEGGVMTPVGAVDVPTVAAAAEVEQPPAVVESAENLPEIVHSPSTTAGNSATARDSCDNALVERVHSRRPRARRWCSGPYSLVRSRGSCGDTDEGANYDAGAGRLDFCGFTRPSTLQPVADRADGIAELRPQRPDPLLEKHTRRHEHDGAPLSHPFAKDD